MYTHLWKYLAELFLEGEMLHENQNTRFMFENFFFFFWKSGVLRNGVEKYGRSVQATDDSIIRRMRFACWTSLQTHSNCVILIAFPRQQWLRKRTSVLR